MRFALSDRNILSRLSLCVFYIFVLILKQYSSVSMEKKDAKEQEKTSFILSQIVNKLFTGKKPKTDTPTHFPFIN